MKLAVATLAAAATAIAVAPSPRSGSTSLAPWPEPVVRAAALGRTYAGADIAWMKTVQLIGDVNQERRGYPSLDEWVDLTTRLDPRFDLPYFFGAVLLVTDDARAPHVDALLARGEEAMPEFFSLAMFRGFLAYFGRLDAKTAAEHYRRAAAKPQAPGWLKLFADRIEREEDSCDGVMRRLAQVSDEASGAQGRALASSQGKVLVHCLKTRLERAAAAWRVRRGGGVPTVADVARDGLIEDPVPAPPGMCWSLDEDQKASLAPCPAGTAEVRP